VLLNAVERRILLADPSTATTSSQQPPSCSYYYTDIDLGGLYCVRGENMVLLGRHCDNERLLGAQQLDWPEWQEKYQAQTSTATAVATQWDFDSDLIA
jgi:hypothetical protein